MRVYPGTFECTPLKGFCRVNFDPSRSSFHCIEVRQRDSLWVWRGVLEMACYRLVSGGVVRGSLNPLSTRRWHIKARLQFSFFCSSCRPNKHPERWSLIWGAVESYHRKNALLAVYSVGINARIAAIWLPSHAVPKFCHWPVCKYLNVTVFVVLALYSLHWFLNETMNKRLK